MNDLTEKGNDLESKHLAGAHLSTTQVEQEELERQLTGYYASAEGGNLPPLLHQVYVVVAYQARVKEMQ